VNKVILSTDECLALPLQGEAPEWRDFHSATRWGDYMIVFGGRCDEHAPILSGKEFYPNDIYMFDPLAQHWTRPEVTGAIPKGRRSHNACKDILFLK